MRVRGWGWEGEGGPDRGGEGGRVRVGGEKVRGVEGGGEGEGGGGRVRVGGEKVRGMEGERVGGERVIGMCELDRCGESVSVRWFLREGERVSELGRWSAAGT